MFVHQDSDIDKMYEEIISHTLSKGYKYPYKNNVSEGFVTESRPTLISTSGKHKYITTRSKFNLSFALAEVLWICQGRRDVEMLAHYNKNISNYSDKGEDFNAAYGNRIFNSSWGKSSYRSSTETVNQFLISFEKLRRNPDNRQTVIQIWHPLYDNVEGCKDYACNQSSQLKIRDGQLEWTQIMRSNDLVWGLPYNLVQFISLQQIMSSMLGVAVGNYYHFSDSSHIYSNMEDEALKDLENDSVFYKSPQLRCPGGYQTFVDTITECGRLEELSRKDPEFRETLDSVLDPGFRNLIATLIIHNKLKFKKLEDVSYYYFLMTDNSFEKIWIKKKIDKSSSK